MHDIAYNLTLICGNIQLLPHYAILDGTIILVTFLVWIVKLPSQCHIMHQNDYDNEWESTPHGHSLIIQRDEPHLQKCRDVIVRNDVK